MSDLAPIPPRPPAVPDAEDAFLALIDRAARDPTFDLMKFEALMKAREREIERLQKNAHIRAMGRTLANIQSVALDGTNTHLHTRYSKLPAMLKVCRDAGSPEGIHVWFGTPPAVTPGWKSVSCIVSHDDGHIAETAVESPILSTSGVRGGQTQTNNVQAIGSTITYLQRYALKLAFGLVLENEVEDDDGEASRGGGGTPPTIHPPHEVDQRTGQAASGQGQGRATGGRSGGPDDQWQRFLDRVGEALGAATTVADVGLINGRAQKTMLDRRAPAEVKGRADRYVAEDLARVAPDGPVKPEVMALIAELAVVASLAVLEELVGDAQFMKRWAELGDDGEHVEAARKQRVADLEAEGAAKV